MAKKSEVKQTKNETNGGSLQRLNLMAGIMQLVQGLIILALGANRVFPVQISYPTPDPIASELQGTQVWSMATRTLFEVNMLYLLAALCLIAAVIHILAATIYRQQQDADIKKRLNKLRWIGSGFVFGALLTITGVLAGIEDEGLLGSMLVLGVLSGLLGLAVEYAVTAKNRALNGLLHTAMTILVLVPLALIAKHLWAAEVYGGSLPAAVYGVQATMVVALIGNGLIGHLQRGRKGQWKDYLFGEKLYLVWSFVTITAVVWQIFVGIL
jgi:hypothetical protein